VKGFNYADLKSFILAPPNNPRPVYIVRAFQGFDLSQDGSLTMSSPQESQVYIIDFRWSVSGNNPQEQQALNVWCKETFADYVYQLEDPHKDQKHNYHYQGYGRLATKRRPSELKKVAISLNGQFNGIRIGVASTAGREILKNYAMKEESRVAGPWSSKPVYLGQDLPSVLFPWQEDVKTACDEEPDDRTINYVIDEKGNTGKSKFCKLMGFKHGALVLPWARTGDILNLVTKLGAKKTYLFDLSRTKPQDWSTGDISAAMESIKNGYVVNTKYETSAFYMACPHIWCFSNQPPVLSSMSKDRWKLWSIRDRKLVPYNRRRSEAAVEIE